MVKCHQSGCERAATHYSATTRESEPDDGMVQYVKYCEKHAKIRWINGYHMMKMGKNE
jgi:hypothetical protein